MKSLLNRVVEKWGNILAIHIPTPEATKAVIQEVDEVDITASLKGRKDSNFDHLYAQITPENCHPETDWRDSVGREI